jgi:large subunit ribosomal protein L10
LIKEKKTQIIDQLEEKLTRSKIVIATSYQGITAKDMTTLRRAISDPAIDYQIVKNNLMRIAAQKAGKDLVMSIVNGPTAIIFGYDDVVKAAKSINQYIKTSGLAITVNGALLGERALTSEEIVTLANLPSREVLISQVVTMLQAPLRGLHNTLNSPLYGLYNVLKARIQDLAK